MELRFGPGRLLREAVERKKCLIAAHRGCWGGPVVQNTLPAFALALRRGADILETDVCLSADGELFCFHDGSEQQVFGREMDLREKPLAQIRALRALNAYGQEVSAVIPTLEETLRFALEHRAFLNIDRAWDHFDRVCALLDRYPEAAERCILKAPMRKGRAAMAYLAQRKVKYMFMPIVYTPQELEEALTYTGVNTVAAEVIASGGDSALYGEAAAERIHGAGLCLWVNALCLGEREKDRLYGRLDDPASLEDPGRGWGEMMRIGADMIQTDWPDLVREERRRQFGG